MITLKTWQDIKNQISEDLALAVLYTAGSMAADTVDSLMILMRHSDYLSEETAEAMYVDICFGLAREEMNDHIGQDDEEVEIYFEALEEGMQALAQWMDLVNNEDAFSYLRYVQDWEENHFDWVNDHPLSLEEFLTGRQQ